MTILVAIVVGIAFLVAGTVLLNFPREIYIRRLARARRAESDAFAKFQASLPAIPDELRRTVYLEVQKLVARNFPLRADDQLLATLDIDQGNLEVLFEELGLPESDPAPATVGDLARALHEHRSRPH